VHVVATVVDCSQYEAVGIGVLCDFENVTGEDEVTIPWELGFSHTDVLDGVDLEPRAGEALGEFGNGNGDTKKEEFASVTPLAHNGKRNAHTVAH
jgi:hypothetical protein